MPHIYHQQSSLICPIIIVYIQSSDALDTAAAHSQPLQCHNNMRHTVASHALSIILTFRPSLPDRRLGFICARNRKGDITKLQGGIALIQNGRLCSPTTDYTNSCILRQTLNSLFLLLRTSNYIPTMQSLHKVPACSTCLHLTALAGSSFSIPIAAAVPVSL